MYCEYGCGEEGIFILKNGKHCCNNNVSKCSFIKEKISKKRRDSKGDIVMPKIKCEFCNIEFGNNVIKRHINKCYLNPQNLRKCPVCDMPIKGSYDTCSKSCSNKIFKTGPQSSTFKGGLDTYRKICFHYNEKKCAVCDESNVVDVHHLDLDRLNNNPINLIPLCPTHHSYIHRGYESEILDKINDWVISIKERIIKYDNMGQLELFNYKNEEKCKLP